MSECMQVMTCGYLYQILWQHVLSLFELLHIVASRKPTRQLRFVSCFLQQGAVSFETHPCERETSKRVYAMYTLNSRPNSYISQRDRISNKETVVSQACLDLFDVRRITLSTLQQESQIQPRVDLERVWSLYKKIRLELASVDSKGDDP